jgi:hypothetical protein
MVPLQMADHPLLLRSHYNDQKVRELAVLLKKHYPVRCASISPSWRVHHLF